MITVKYDCLGSCNKCGGNNDVTITDTMDGIIMECETVCKSCGFKDCWATGFFESGQNIVGKCKKYSFPMGRSDKQ